MNGIIYFSVGIKKYLRSILILYFQYRNACSCTSVDIVGFTNDVALSKLENSHGSDELGVVGDCRELPSREVRGV